MKGLRRGLLLKDAPGCGCEAGCVGGDLGRSSLCILTSCFCKKAWIVLLDPINK